MANSSKPLRVFVSYTADQRETGQTLIDGLRDAGFNPTGPSDAQTGDDWRKRIEDSVSSADSYVVLIGQEPTRSDRTEWQAIIESNWAGPAKPIVPVLVDDASLPAGFAEWQALRLEPEAPSKASVRVELQSAIPKIVDALETPRHEPVTRGDLAHRLDRIGALNTQFLDDIG
jgi:hypothetical protein